MGDKIATFIHNVSGAVAAVVIGFWRAWDIFVVLIASFPALVLAGLLSAKGMQWLRNSTEKAYAGANGVAQESFSNIRVVAAYGGEGVQHTTYSRLLSSVKRIVPILSLVDGEGAALCGGLASVAAAATCGARNCQGLLQHLE